MNLFIYLFFFWFYVVCFKLINLPNLYSLLFQLPLLLLLLLCKSGNNVVERYVSIDRIKDKDFLDNHLNDKENIYRTDNIPIGRVDKYACILSCNTFVVVSEKGFDPYIARVNKIEKIFPNSFSSSVKSPSPSSIFISVNSVSSVKRYSPSIEVVFGKDNNGITVDLECIRLLDKFRYIRYIFSLFIFYFK